MGITSTEGIPTMPLRMETPPADTPDQDEVDAIVRRMRAWRSVTPDQRAALRAAAAALPLIPVDPPTTTPIDRPMRIAEVAQILGVHRATIRRLIVEGQLRGYQLRPNTPGSEWRVNESEVRRYLAGGAA